ncbi:MAG TPA: YbaK/EbsC family protein, partial [Anaerolineales bacterium]
MKFAELNIQTQREAPKNARTQGFALLVRAGYLSRERELLPLGKWAVGHFEKLAAADASSFLFHLSLPTLRSDSETFFPISTGPIQVLHCPACGYAARQELASFRKSIPPVETALPLEKVSTPNCNTIESLAGFLGIPAEKTAKAMMFTRVADGKFVFVVLRGDMALSEAKLSRAVGAVRLASEDEIVRVGAIPGYASPIGLTDALVIVDDLIPGSPNLVAGANEDGHHLLNTNHGRDYRSDLVEDLVRASEGDPCPECGAALAAENAEVLSSDGAFKFDNILLALAETFHDDKGLTLPAPASLFDVYLMHINGKEMDTRAAANELYAALEAADISVLFDERDERAGVKFNDADLIGPPLRVTVGEKSLRNRMVELKAHTEQQSRLIPMDTAVREIAAALKKIS